MNAEKNHMASWKILLIIFGAVAGLILIAQVDTQTHIFSGLLGLALGLILLAVVVCWIAFPIIVLSKFNELLKIQAEIGTQMINANRASLEIAKALQWMVDNWPQHGERKH